LDGLGEDVPDAEGMLPQHVRIDAQGHGWIGMAEPGSYNVIRDTCKPERGRVQVAQVMKAGVRERR
jgi:hypothetical protein